jgi:hypothetical protein
MSQKEDGYRRIVRMRRIMAHAAELIEREAKALQECHTLDGDWGDELDAKEEYDDRIETARELRALLGV